MGVTAGGATGSQSVLGVGNGATEAGCEGSFAPLGLDGFPIPTHSLRCGLHSCAALRLEHGLGRRAIAWIGLSKIGHYPLDNVYEYRLSGWKKRGQGENGLPRLATRGATRVSFSHGLLRGLHSCAALRLGTCFGTVHFHVPRQRTGVSALHYLRRVVLQKTKHPSDRLTPQG